MDWNDVVDVLSVVAGFDRRKVGTTDIEAWQTAFRVRDVTSKDDAVRAVAEHYANTDTWIMPVHVINRVRVFRADRIRDIVPTDLVADVDVDDPRYLQILRARTRAAADTPPAVVAAITARGAQ